MFGRSTRSIAEEAMSTIRAHVEDCIRRAVATDRRMENMQLEAQQGFKAVTEALAKVGEKLEGNRLTELKTEIDREKTSKKFYLSIAGTIILLLFGVVAKLAVDGPPWAEHSDQGVTVVRPHR